MDRQLHVRINGKEKMIAVEGADTSLEWLLGFLELKADRIAVEHNGTIATRILWASTQVQDGDKLEIVHFVGGGRT